MTRPLRVLLADDHAIVRQGLKLLIDSQPDMAVVGESADGNGVLDRATALKPDIVVMDLSMPGMNGLVATRTLTPPLVGEPSTVGGQPDQPAPDGNAASSRRSSRRGSSTGLTRSAQWKGLPRATRER